MSLGIYASDEGMKQAEVQAKALGSLLARGKFVWAEWLRGPQQLYGLRPHELFHVDLSGLKENPGTMRIGH
ncbi:MAG: hypothetical protein JO235_20235 [Chroococcidiopsidaceae cyanobacterium CP_BM_RX_35]|nr:hypothetical protein [Chroococcidiopsidaceae cyanobacterium CP_BM_RX_35]